MHCVWSGGGTKTIKMIVSRISSGSQTGRSSGNDCTTDGRRRRSWGINISLSLYPAHNHSFRNFLLMQLSDLRLILRRMPSPSSSEYAKKSTRLVRGDLNNVFHSFLRHIQIKEDRTPEGRLRLGKSRQWVSPNSDPCRIHFVCRWSCLHLQFIREKIRPPHCRVAKADWLWRIYENLN